MKAIRLFAVVVAFLAFFLFPSAVSADDDDFEVDYDIWPGAIGSNGGDIRVTLDITNTGPTDITSVNCVINTVNGFSERWTGTIAPGRSRPITFIVPFADLDVNRERILQVAMNNNITANPDGIKMFTFRVARLHPVINVSASVSPAKPVYRPGETVTITSVYTNRSATHAATGFKSYIEMYADGRGIYAGSWEDHGNVFPGASVSPAFRYTIGENVSGSVTVKYFLRFGFIGRDYDISNESLSFTVEAPQPEFTASLEAEPARIDAGDIVKFAVYYTNTGDYATDFSVADSEGHEISSASGAPAGWEGHTGVNMPVDESCDFYYVVTGTIGGESVSVRTNTVHITVREPEPSAETSSAPPSSASSVSSGMSEPSPAASATFAPPSSSASSEPAAALSPQASEQAATAPAAIDNTLIYILIGAVVILAGAVALLFILLKKK